MKRRLTITIDAGEKTCGACHRLYPTVDDHGCITAFCTEFHDGDGSSDNDCVTLDLDGGNRPLRCQPCLDAEVRDE